MCVACTLLGVFIGVPDAFFTQGLTGTESSFCAINMRKGGRHTLRSTAPARHLRHSTSGKRRGFCFCSRWLGPLCWPAGGSSSPAGTAIGGPVAFYVAYFSLQRAFFERNLSHVAPFLSILAAVALLALCEALPLPARTKALVALLALTVVARFVGIRQVSFRRYASKSEAARCGL